MSCCKWKRGRNDALLDSESNTFYCGTCWQSWLSTQINKPSKHAHPSTPATTPVTPVPSQLGLVEDTDALGELQGKTHTDGNLYLISTTTNLVFDTQRADDGRLRCVGHLKPCASGGDDDEIRLYRVEDVANNVDYPFNVQPEDHCETPFEAYQDLAPYLSFLATCLGREPASLRIWDPYYCQGAVKRHFARLGFTNVHNECVDFYRLVDTAQLPPYDCIVTNPPYSTEPTDHVHRLVKILCAQRKPWFVVQPNYVYTKPYWLKYTALTLPAPRPFFLTPSMPRKYKYKTPSGLRHVASAQHLKTSPFISMWYCWVGPQYTEKLYRWIASNNNASTLPLSLACTEYFLPDSFKDSSDKTRRKPRKGKKRNQDPQHSSPIRDNTVRKRKRRKNAKEP